MTSILYHSSDAGAFLAADTLRHNTVDGTTKKVRKVFCVTSQVLLAGGGVSNGVAGILNGLNHYLGSNQDAILSEVVELVCEGIRPSYDNGNSERTDKGYDPLPLVIYLAGINDDGAPSVELIEQNTMGLSRITYRGELGCMSVDSNNAKSAIVTCYERMRDKSQDGKVHLAEWSLESVVKHQEMFPGKVGAPIDCGIVTPSGQIAFAENYPGSMMNESFMIEGLQSPL